MVTPALIGSFATLDGILLGQFAYAVSHYRGKGDRDRESRPPR